MSSQLNMQTCIANIAAAFPWLIVERDGKCGGYAYAAKWQDCSAYRHSVLTTIYLDEAARRLGVGTTLYLTLLEKLRTRAIHNALGGISLPNAASVALHEKCGFKKVAHFDQVGFKFGRWIDVGYWQLML